MVLLYDAGDINSLESSCDVVITNIVQYNTSHYKRGGMVEGVYQEPGYIKGIYAYCDMYSYRKKGKIYEKVLLTFALQKCKDANLKVHDLENILDINMFHGVKIRRKLELVKEVKNN